MPSLAQRLSGIKPSPIARLSQRVRDLRAEGHDVIDLGVGEPDFDTPDFIKRATTDAMDRGETRYTGTHGTMALRQAICAKFLRENGLRYRPDEIAVGSGAKQVIFNALMATLDAGDEVILPAPYWASYPEMVRFSGGTPVEIACPQETGFRLQPKALSRAITPRTKWLFLNSPSNPAGAAYDEADLRALGAVLLQHPQVWVLSDDIYEHLLFDRRRFATIAGAEPRLLKRTVTVNGVSKTYAMTGWRLGYAGAPQAMVEAMANVQSQCTTHASSLSQAGALAALTGPQEFVRERVAIFQQRRDLAVAALNAMPGFACATPEGAFFVFPDCRGLLGRTAPSGRRIESDFDLSRYLTEEARVSTVPGTFFGLGPHIRLSTAVATDVLQEALRRVGEACARLS